MSEDHEKMLQDVRRVLDEQNHNLDSSTLSRLNRARQRALESRKKRRSNFWGWTLVPATATVLMVLLLRQPADFLQPANNEISDLQILTSEESLEFFQEDMAFYEWIEEVIENESVHNHNDDTLGNINNNLVSSVSHQRETEQQAGGRKDSGWRVFGISRFI